MRPGHVESLNPLRDYNRVIVTLAVLTGVEFGVAIFMKDRPDVFLAGVLVLIALAAWKAVLVARTFMHLKYDPRLLALIAFIPVVLGVPLVLLTIFDFTRVPAF